MPAPTPHFPGDEWETRPAGELGFDEAKLEEGRRHLAEVLGPEGRYRVCLVRNGYIAAEWNAGVDVDERIEIASAQKSVYSCLLGIAIGEGRIGSVDDLVRDYYPEMLQVPEGTGPKPNRSNKPEDAQITFRHLVTNTSGYLKPGELPGEQYHYQSFGLCILMHAIGKAYGVYDSSDPEGSPGEGELIRTKIRDRIGGTWTWSWGNFDLPAKARIGIFGYHTSLSMTARDMCRLGWLWCNLGDWDGHQVVPEEWLRKATVAARIARVQSPSDPLTHGRRAYGHGFWCNDQGQLWPHFPADSFAAAGAWNRLIWVCPSLHLVVAQNPGIRAERPVLETRVIEWVLDALANP